MLSTQKRPEINRIDFYLVSFIGASFALFSIPILINLHIPTLTITVTTALLMVIFFIFFANLALSFAWFISKYIPVVFQIAKFGAVGAFNTFLDWGVLNLLIAITGISSGFGFSLFKSISFIVAAISAYFWNKYWTFEAKDKSNKQEVGRFIIISVTGFIINVGLASLIVTLFTYSTPLSPEQLANVAAAVATLASLIWNFLGYKLFVFKK